MGNHDGMRKTDREVNIGELDLTVYYGDDYAADLGVLGIDYNVCTELVNMGYELVYDSDGTTIIGAVKQETSSDGIVVRKNISQSEIAFLTSVSDGTIKLEGINTDADGGRIRATCDLSYFGYDGVSEESRLNAIRLAEQSGINFTVDGDILVFSSSDEMNTCEHLLYDYISPVAELNGNVFVKKETLPPSMVNAYYDGNYYVFNFTEEEYRRYIPSGYAWSVVDNQYDINVSLGLECELCSPNLDFLLDESGNIKDLSTLSENEMLILAQLGYFVGGYRDKNDGTFHGRNEFCYGFRNAGMLDGGSYEQDGQKYYRIWVPVNEGYSDDFLFYAMGLTESQVPDMKRYTEYYNGLVNNVVDERFGVDGMSIFPVEIDENGNYTYSYYDNVNDYNNSKFLVNYNGFYVEVDNINGEELVPNINSTVLEKISLDNQSYDDLGFVMSVLMDSNIDDISVLNSNLSGNLQERGYENIVAGKDGLYRIYLSNGQCYIVSSDDINRAYNSETPFSISQLVSNVDASDAMKNLNVQNYLMNQENLQDYEVDVRSAGDSYEIYVNGEIYSVPRNQVERYDENGNMVLTDDELADAIFHEISPELPGENVDKVTTRNGFVPGFMFTPCIDLKNEEYYRKLCEDLLGFNEQLMNYSSDISGIDIDSKFFRSRNTRDNYCNEIREVADECVELSKKVEYCVNLVTQFDISLKSTLDKYIEELFDNVTADVIRDESGKVTVDNQKYVDFFREKMTQAGEEVKYYDLIISGKMEITEEVFNELTSNMDFGLDWFEQVEINGVVRYFTDAWTVGYYLEQKTDYDGPEDQTEIYNYVLNLPNEELDDSLIGLKTSIVGMSSIFMDIEGSVRYRDSLNAFSNTKPYVNYILSDEYSEILSDVKNGEYDENFRGSCLESYNFPEYFTDFQKTLLIMSFKDAEAAIIANELNDPFGQYYNADFEKMDNVTKNLGLYSYIHGDLSNKWKELCSSMEEIVPYSTEKIQGYYEAIEKINAWIADGKIDIFEFLGYGGERFGAGFIEIGTNIMHIFNPESNKDDYKNKFVLDILSSYTGISLADLPKVVEEGRISEYEANLREKMLGITSGITPAGLNTFGNIMYGVGNGVSEAVLDIVAKKIGIGWVVPIVKGMSMGGKTVHEMRFNGYSLEASYAAGLVAGLVTFGLENKWGTGQTKGEDLLELGDGSVKYNPFTGKLSLSQVSDATKAKQLEILNKHFDMMGDMGIHFDDLDEALEFINDRGYGNIWSLLSPKDALVFNAYGFGSDMFDYGVETASQIAFGGFKSYTTDTLIGYTASAVDGREYNPETFPLFDIEGNIIEFGENAQTANYWYELLFSDKLGENLVSNFSGIIK